MKKKILLLIGIFLLVSLVMQSRSVIKGSAELKSSGDFKIDIPLAKVYMNYMKRINIWHIWIHTPTKDYKKNGKKGTVHLFFSKNFNIKKGKFPIAFSYLNKKDTMGATFFSRELPKKTMKFTYDTKGEINFTKVGDLIEGEFLFSVFSDKENKMSVKISGKFSVPRKNGFPGIPKAK